MSCRESKQKLGTQSLHSSHLNWLRIWRLAAFGIALALPNNRLFETSVDRFDIRHEEIEGDEVMKKLLIVCTCLTAILVGSWSSGHEALAGNYGYVSANGCCYTQPTRSRTRWFQRSHRNVCHGYVAAPVSSYTSTGCCGTVMASDGTHHLQQSQPYSSNQYNGYSNQYNRMDATNQSGPPAVPTQDSGSPSFANPDSQVPPAPSQQNFPVERSDGSSPSPPSDVPPAA